MGTVVVHGDEYGSGTVVALSKSSTLSPDLNPEPDTLNRKP